MSKPEEKVQLVVCPWCFSTIELETEEEPFTCPNCCREFSDDDLDFTENQDN